MKLKSGSLKSLALVVCLASSVNLLRAAGLPVDPATGGVSFTGSVVETMNTGGYTYVQVETGGQKLWAATTEFMVKKDDTVTVFNGMPMANYHSSSLNRDFDLVYFTGKIAVKGAKADEAPALPPGHPALPPPEAAPMLPAGHPSLAGSTVTAKTDLTGIKRADGGKTVAEIFAGRNMLAGQPVAARGRVVKYKAMVMGKNWLHVRDGSGSDAAQDNDLTVTTATAAKLGDTVLVSGIVTTNKDFGAGYKYTVILDDAKVTVE